MRARFRRTAELSRETGNSRALMAALSGIRIYAWEQERPTCSRTYGEYCAHVAPEPLWFLGFPDRARKRGEEALILAGDAGVAGLMIFPTHSKS
jgi:hypothetical protein